MSTNRVDGFGILLGVDEEDEREGHMVILGREDVGKSFALQKRHCHREGQVWIAVGYEYSCGVENYEWEITSVINREGL